MDGSPRGGDHGYRVLARKYRPTSFDDLIGQDPMVRTLSNAFQAGRIAQAWMLTGVRGVGKTTTARILARALNYEIPEQIDQPTIDMGELGVHCQAIMEGRHVDVIEMDAASHTGINDIREITDAARYKPVSARYKVYIIDEVHMLSNAAFNGLLKTLEEPPEHVKFVFATTEIRKVPVTVLSRCQRFDLRRIDADLLVTFLKKIAAAESVDIEDNALAMIARAAEGSVRDSLSLLDQAIAHGAASVTADTVRAMLGLADRAVVVDLFEAVMRGDVATALDLVKEQYDVGAEPAIILADLAEFTHLVTRFKVSDSYDGGQAVTEVERERGRTFASDLSIRVLSRAWQILLKGVSEVQLAPRPLAAADMVLVRLCHAADLPAPDELARQIRDGTVPAGPGPAPEAAAPKSEPGPSAGPGPDTTPPRASASLGNVTALMRVDAKPKVEPEPVLAPVEAEPDPVPVEDTDGPQGPLVAIRSLRDIADAAGERRDLHLKFSVERHVRLVSMETGRMEIAVEPGAPPDLAHRLGRFLQDVTGERWMIIVSREAGGETLHEIDQREQARQLSDAASHPDVAAVLQAFPGAEIVDVRVVPREVDAVDETGLDDGGESELGGTDDT